MSYGGTALDGPGFAICRGKGFHIRFENGNTVSVQWGPGNYCENRSSAIWPENQEELAGERGCKTAEVGAWDADGEWYKLAENDNVIGWQTSAQVLVWLHFFGKGEAKATEEEWRLVRGIIKKKAG